MDTKQLIADKISHIVPELDKETIVNLIETPKNTEMGDLAFPTFSLAKIMRKAPQMIASELAEKIDTNGFEKVVATGPYLNFFLDKSAISQQILSEIISQGSDYGKNNI
ncbi:MAG: arginine--tRNA ligase, partial [Streptococcus gallolyticus]|nr:arginine--tRNA ligase [Streptococcus gallolyticus]